MCCAPTRRVRRGADAGSRSALGFVAVSPLLLGSVWLNSYDAWPAALTAGSAASARSPALPCPRSACSGLAAAAKVYASASSCRLRSTRASRLGHARSRQGVASRSPSRSPRRRPVRRALPGGVWASFRSQLERGLHVESLGASVLLALDRLGLYDATVSGGSTAAKSRDLAGSLPTRSPRSRRSSLIAAPSSCGSLFARRADDLQRLAAAFAACVAAVLAASKILSPQYAEWLVFLVPLAAGAAGAQRCCSTAAAFVLAERGSITTRRSMPSATGSGSSSRVTLVLRRLLRGARLVARDLVARERGDSV